MKNIDLLDNTLVTDYDYYNNVSKKNDEELKELGFSEEEIKALRDFDYTEELKSRALLDNKTLEFMGYSEADIIYLRKLLTENSNEEMFTTFNNGGTDSGGVFATLRLTTYKISKTNNQVMIGFEWIWDKLPVFYGGREMVAAVWNGTNNSGQPLNVRINDSNASSYQYIVNQNNLNGPRTTKYTFTVDDYYHAAYSSFHMGSRVEELIDWAKSGYGRITLNASGTSAIKEVALKLKYGHTRIGIGSPGVSFAPVSLGISFTANMDDMATVNSIYN